MSATSSSARGLGGLIQTSVGAGPASLTVARDLAPLGYECIVFDADPQGVTRLFGDRQVELRN